MLESIIYDTVKTKRLHEALPAKNSNLEHALRGQIRCRCLEIIATFKDFTILLLTDNALGCNHLLVSIVDADSLVL